MNWEVILWTCITVGVLLVACALLFWIISAKNIRKQRKQVGDLQTTLKVGTRIVFAGGLYGRIVKATNDDIDVEISKGVIVKASRYSIQGILDKK